MNREDYRSLTDDGLADVMMMQQKLDALRATVVEQQQTIGLLQEDNRTLRAAGGTEAVEVRRQLAESEMMRARMGDEMQALRTRIQGCIDMAAGAIREEMLALSELADMGYLNITGLDRLEALRDWLRTYEQG